MSLTYAYKRHTREDRPDRHVWSVVGAEGGVHIWAQLHDADFQAKYGEQFFGGVECHWPAGDDPAHHPECWLLGKPCRHDGSSLYFSDYIEPVLRGMDLSSEAAANFVNAELLDWYQSKISRQPP